MLEIQITQVSISGKDDKITIKYKQGDRARTETGKDEATAEFYYSMQSFVSMFVESAGLDSEWWQDGTVTGIALKHSDAGIAIAISGTAKVNNKYASMTSPSRIIEAGDRKLVEELSKQAIAYLDGDRSQQSLLT